MRIHRGAVLILVAIMQPAARADGPAAPELPRVVLVGDSIRLGYAPKVAQRLAGKATVISSQANGGDSANVLAHLDEWVLRERPDLVLLNCGLHDLKRPGADGPHQVELDRYEANLRRIAARIREGTKATFLFVNTTPVLDDRHAQRRAGFDRFEADVRRYNAAAASVFHELGVPILDLHGIIERVGPETLLGSDGTHFTPPGEDRVAEAVADCVKRTLTIARYRPLPTPPSGADAAASYRRAQEERDREVPSLYKESIAPEFRPSSNTQDWERRRPIVLRAVLDSLGDIPPRPAPHRTRLVSRELRSNYALESIAIDNGVDGEVTALVLIPDRRNGPMPAVLWLHSSTPDKTQVLIPKTNGGDEPLGEALVRAGFVVMAPDAYWHGDRAGTGPSGPATMGRAEQEDLFKRHLWLGRTLWGMFVRDDRIALDHLCGRPEVDPRRIGAIGMSMGSTRAWWLADVDDRVAAVVAVACLTRYQNLMAHGELRQHGVYYFVDGLLKHFDVEGVLALIAPRPFLALTGELDAGSPADGVRALERPVGATYEALGARERFRSILYPEVGHEFTAAMRAEALAWFDRWLRPRGRGGDGAGR
jgi:lysophospholipase L1-like esterase/dienelactone hydrolase